MDLRAEGLGGRTATPEDGWDYYEEQRDRREMARLGERLAWATGDLVWTIDGKGVYGNTVTMGQLEVFSKPLRGLLRWTQRDLVVKDGAPVTDAAIWSLVEPVVAGFVPGSFGLRIMRPPLAEAPDLFGTATLFERAADRIVSVFAAARDSIDGSGIVPAVAGLRINTLSHLHALATAVIESDGTSEIQWRGDNRVGVTPSTATAVIRELRRAAPEPDTFTVVGLLDGGAVRGKSFILYPDGEGKPYRGSVSNQVASQLPSLHFDERVVAVLAVTYSESPKSLEPTRKYTLVSVEPTMESN